MVGRSPVRHRLRRPQRQEAYDKKRYGDACFPAGFASGPKTII